MLPGQSLALVEQVDFPSFCAQLLNQAVRATTSIPEFLYWPSLEQGAQKGPKRTDSECWNSHFLGKFLPGNTKLKIRNPQIFCALQHLPSDVLLYLPHGTNSIPLDKKGSGETRGAGRGRGEESLGSLTEVINLYKGCLLSVYFTVMGLRS